MKKINELLEPVTKLVCALAGFALLGLGAMDVQSDQVEKGSTLNGVSVPLVGYVVGKKNGAKKNEEGEDNGD
jgi:hypothetical protein